VLSACKKYKAAPKWAAFFYLLLAKARGFKILTDWESLAIFSAE